jgi:DNA replication protein DnaC
MALSSPQSSITDEQVECVEHGSYIAHQIVISGKVLGRRSGCPKCVENRQKAEDEERRKRDEAERQDRIERALSRAGIPYRFQGKTFDTYEADTAGKARAKSHSMVWANEFKARLKDGGGIVFSGAPGTGKSHLACSIAQHIMEAGHTAMYLTSMDMIRMIRATWRRDSERTESQVLETLCGVDLLILDEVGMQYGSEGEQVILTDVIDQRYRDMLPIIILTNQDRKGLAEYLGHRAFDRLRDGGLWESLDWESYRGRK